jgi:hypothetical protein
MDTQPTFNPRDHLIADIAQSVSQRQSESPQQRVVRVLAATAAILAFQPRDAIEAMLAGHCLMFHELIVDSVHRTLRDEADAPSRPTRSGIVAMDKAFGDNLTRLERYRTRDAEASPEARSTPAHTETNIADRVLRHRQRAPVQQASAPSPEPIPADHANPATPSIPDPAPLGVDHPPEDRATARISGFNCQPVGNSSQPQRYAHAGNRHARRHPARQHEVSRASAADQ